MTRINLIREAAAQPECRANQGRPLRWLAMLIVIAALHWAENAWVGSVIETRDSLRRSVEGLERSAARLRSTSLPVAPADRATGPSRPAVRLRSIAASVPPDVWLVGYREHQGEATMRGMALNDEAMRTFADSLSATSVFGHVEITETTRIGAAGEAGESARASYEFQLKATLQDAAPGAADDVASPN